MLYKERVSSDLPLVDAPRLTSQAHGASRAGRRAVNAALLGAVLIGGLAACSGIRNRLITPDPPVREQQRAAALYFHDEWQPNVEKIRFTRDGDRPGLGAATPPLPLTVTYSDGTSEGIE